MTLQDRMSVAQHGLLQCESSVHLKYIYVFVKYSKTFAILHLVLLVSRKINLR